MSDLKIITCKEEFVVSKEKVEEQLRKISMFEKGVIMTGILKSWKDISCISISEHMDDKNRPAGFIPWIISMERTSDPLEDIIYIPTTNRYILLRKLFYKLYKKEDITIL